MNKNKWKNLDPLSIYFHKTNTRKRHKNSLLFVNFVTVNYYLWFQYLLIFHFRIPVSILSSFSPLADFDHGFPLSLANISIMINKRYLLGKNDSFICFSIREGLRVVHGSLFLDLTRPEPAKRWPGPSRACRQKDQPAARPAARPFPHMYILKLNWIIY